MFRNHRPLLTAAGFGLLTVCVVAAFGIFGPGSPLGRLTILALAAMGLALLPRPPLAALWPAVGALLLVPQLGPAVYLYDGFVLVAFVATVAWTVQQEDRRVWDVGPAGLLALATLVVPLLALPGAVVSVKSFLGQYKFHVAYVIVFFALRRLVRPEDSRALLWVGPVVGLLAAFQLLSRTAGAGIVSLQRLSMRNFHSALGWGQSNYIAAVLVLCFFLTVLLLVLERRGWLRACLAGACLVMLQAFVVLYSRTATVALGVFFLVLILARGGRIAIVSALAAVVTVAGFALTPFGAVLASRFTDPTELASVKVRIDIWKSAIERFQREPWTGVGLNQGRYQMDIMDIDHAHNTFLDYLSAQGIFGVLLWVALLVALFRLALGVRVDGADPRTIRVLCVAILVAVVVNSMAEPTWNAYVYTMLLVHLIAWMSHQRGPTLAAGPSSR